VIRAVIQGRLGQTPRAAAAEPPKPMDWFWPAILLLLVAVEFMAGWSLDPISFTAFLAAFLVMYHLRLAACRVEVEHRFSFSAYVAVFIARCAGIAFLVWLVYDPDVDTATLIGVVLGGIVTDMIDGSRGKVLPTDSPQHMLHWIAEPLLFKRPDADLPERFEPQFPFQAQNDKSVWAIDPDRRAVRVMLPSEDDLDIVLPWDEPVRAVALRRYRRRPLPLGGHIGPVLRGDRELVVTSGADKARAWTHIFHFSGADKALALRWRDAFESWMREDQRSSTATSAR
jgi:hypothetical protein